MPASCPAAPTYQRRTPETSVLYRTVQAHLETFLARTAGEEGTPGLPGFVKRYDGHMDPYSWDAKTQRPR